MRNRNKIYRLYINFYMKRLIESIHRIITLFIKIAFIIQKLFLFVYLLTKKQYIIVARNDSGIHSKN